MPVPSPDDASLTEDHSKLVTDHLHLAQVVAGDYSNISGLDRDDVLQEARKALIHAALKFDPSRGTKFSSYAGQAIRNTLKDLYGRQKKIKEMEAVHLEEPIFREGERNEDNLTGYDVTTEQRENDQQIEKRESNAIIASQIARLPERTQIMVRGFMAGKTYAILAEEMGISRPAICTILHDAFKTLRQRLYEGGYQSDGSALYAPRTHREISGEEMLLAYQELLNEARAIQQTGSR
ncbi:MAG: sigma-70 family RNA polymerase sigma factor [Verrucomicrobium sp.]|nr:sigma-70 family RNA polymerase sigma factor [Verrucomicrobium sp.]